ncbi:MAG TPA: amidohydrolase, partial [Cytophagales bacterium]|nr:amidohydrolase [Cytophagales bacterium]
RDGKVETLGANASVPAGAVVYDLTGYTIYPSFVELYSDYGVPEPERSSFNWGAPPQLYSNTDGAYNWNQAIRSQYRAATDFDVSNKDAGTWRKLGFGTVLTHHQDGISRGSGVLVTLGEGRPQEQILIEDAAHFLSFNKGTSRQQYPSSLMGSIALLRQTYADAQWYAAQDPKPFEDMSLDAWNRWQGLPQIMTVGSKLDLLRADRVADEFGARYIIRGGADAYQRINEIKAANVDLILPINFPEAYDVTDPYDARVVSLAEMKHWEMAPSNPKALIDAGITFAFTTDGLKKKGDYLKMVRKAIEYGLTEEQALAAMTTIPARMARAEGMVGALKGGMVANFIVTDGSLFAGSTKIYQNWVQGKPYVISDITKTDYAGIFEVSIDGSAVGTLKIEGEPGSQKMKLVVNDSTEKDVKATLDEEKVTITLTVGEGDDANTYRLSGYRMDQNWEG